MREYFTKKPPSGDYEWWDIPNTDSLARVVWEKDEVIDTGMLDAAGNPIMAREKKNPMGFVWPR